MRVGLCEDDFAIRRVVNDAMRLAGHEVVNAHNGGEALRLFVDDDALDVVILDIGLPDADGRDVCLALRTRGVHAPVLFLTARDGVHDRMAGFSAGGDDYLTKPFHIPELIARLRVLLRRTETSATATTSGLVLDPAQHALTLAGKSAPLSPTEFRLLAALLGRPSEVLRRKELLRAGWPDGAIVHENTLDQYVARVRRKLAQVDAPDRIETVRGVGYRVTTA